MSQLPQLMARLEEGLLLPTSQDANQQPGAQSVDPNAAASPAQALGRPPDCTVFEPTLSPFEMLNYNGTDGSTTDPDPPKRGKVGFREGLEVLPQLRPELWTPDAEEGVREGMQANGPDRLPWLLYLGVVGEEDIVVELLEVGTAREDERQEVADVELQGYAKLDRTNLLAEHLPKGPINVRVLDLVKDDVLESGQGPAGHLQHEVRVQAPQVEGGEARQADRRLVHEVWPQLPADGEVL
ncbi:hypothetical protein NUW54_g13908 [Trametes sanguinea]|uniref:Uncharacterized protein n=1 Tax=Trametes sanguinea TaxID=158606 RepID=A0ACC1MHT9_9APHY|nr:hypothetical protein NUW54_g13908 [Trametes sanguinea]